MRFLISLLLHVVHETIDRSIFGFDTILHHVVQEAMIIASWVLVGPATMNIASWPGSGIGLLVYLGSGIGLHRFR